MNLRSDNRSDRRRQVAAEFQIVPHYVGLVVFLEVILATALVFGLFAAACTPFGWSGGVQFLLCAVLGGLLWFVDDKLDRVMKSVAARAVARVIPPNQLPDDHVIPGVVKTLEADLTAAGVAKAGE